MFYPNKKGLSRLKTSHVNVPLRPHSGSGKKYMQSCIPEHFLRGKWYKKIETEHSFYNIIDEVSGKC
jgi:hypothetical protein